jgi:hypothetical protein
MPGDRYTELFPDADTSVEILPLDMIVTREQERALRLLDIVACARTQVARGSWIGAVVLTDDVWLLPPLPRADAVHRRLRDFLERVAPIEPKASPHVPRARWTELREAIESAAQRVRLVTLMDWDEDGSQRKLTSTVRTELGGISPSWAPLEVADAIVRLGYHRRLPRRKLFSHWFRFHRMAPDTLVIAQLPSGRRISFSDDDDDRPLANQVAPLISSILSDAMDRVVRQPVKPGWDKHLAFVSQEISDTVEHTVMGGMHPYIAQVMLWAILQQLARQQFLSYVVAAFPHLNAASERLADTIAAAKKGAVLILGSDTGESLVRLHEIREIAETDLGLSGIIIKDQPELVEHGLVGKLHAYGAMARFVIVENSHPSGHLYELPHLKVLEVVTVVLQERGKGASHMPDDSLKKNPLVRVFTYTPATLRRVLLRAAAWAEARLEKNAEINRRAWKSWYDAESDRTSAKGDGIGRFRPWDTEGIKWDLGEDFGGGAGIGMRVVMVSKVIREPSPATRTREEVPRYPAGTKAMVEIMEIEGADVVIPAHYEELPPVRAEVTFAMAIGFPGGRTPQRLLRAALGGLVERGVISRDQPICFELFLLDTDRNDHPTEIKLRDNVEDLLKSLTFKGDDLSFWGTSA